MIPLTRYIMMQNVPILGLIADIFSVSDHLESAGQFGDLDLGFD